MSAHPNNTIEQKQRWQSTKSLRPQEIKDARRLINKARRQMKANAQRGVK